MSRSDLLTLIGIIVAIIVGIPSFLLLFLTEQQLIGTLILVFALIIIADLLYYFYDVRRPDFTIISYHKKLKILERDGTHARITLHQKLRANHKGLSEFIYRNIRADGEIRNFLVATGPYEKGAGNPVEARKAAGDYIVRQSFPYRLRKWGSIEITLIFELFNSFRGPHREWTGYVVDYKTKVAKIEVYLPSDRPCLSAGGYCRTGAQQSEIEAPAISDRNVKIVWEHRNLQPPSNYIIKWNW